ncbi:MAG: TetR/AcrR family transcriptional regulator [Chloroflexi bacterium]|nr:TetR/AcrR family transcriptional regulator [Chloroflexota bacterium]MCL5275533.1 TetR/AcrR family transcriptional regulator [Chloroflexota bacterium]
MARTIKEQEYAVKRNEILDVAERLMVTKGYQQMTIQDVLDGLKISKGAFYHYFDSKSALLEALIERILDRGIEALTPIAQDTRTPALERIQRYFETAARWKAAQMDLMLALLRIWYTDDNAIVRQKMLTNGLKRIAPILTEMILQGVKEGVLNPAYPERAAEVVMVLMEGFGDSLAQQILSPDPASKDPQRMETTTAVFTDALERILGAPKNSLHIVELETLKAWMVNP